MDERPIPSPKVLVIDDAESFRALVGRVLGPENVALAEARDGRDGFAQARAIRPDLILLDVQLPGGDGFEVLRQLQCDPATRSIPVMFLSSFVDPAVVTRGLDLGAVDFIAKSSTPEELRARVRAALRTKFKRDELERQAHLDGLTGLGNRLALEERLEADWEGARRRGAAMAILIADLDRFKLVNDCDGHPGGDRLLRATARVLRDSVRGGDFLSRYGGDEFVVVAHDCGLAGAMAVGERFRAAVAALGPPDSPASGPATVSVGVAASEPGDDGPQEILGRADAALYRAKSAGRDSVWACDHGAMRPAAEGALGATAPRLFRDAGEAARA